MRRSAGVSRSESAVERDERDAVPDFAQELAGSGIDLGPIFRHSNRSRFDTVEVPDAMASKRMTIGRASQARR
jgi:hypothetical protein